MDRNDCDSWSFSFERELAAAVIDVRSAAMEDSVMAIKPRSRAQG